MKMRKYLLTIFTCKDCLGTGITNLTAIFTGCLTDFLPPPDLVVYLRASVPTLVGRICLRGRDYERQISPEYLAQLNDLYERWISHFSLCPVLAVPADDLDYVAIPAHLDLVVRKIEEKLMGKEEVIFNAEEMGK